MPDTHGGRPPPNAKSYSQATPPARGTRSGSSSSSSWPAAVLLFEDHSALSFAKLASGWNCRPWPGKYCQTSSEPENEIRRVDGPATWVVQ